MQALPAFILNKINFILTIINYDEVFSVCVGKAVLKSSLVKIVKKSVRT